MGTPLEIRVSQKQHLSVLLRIKEANTGKQVDELQEAILQAVSVMEAEDVAYVEKIINVKAI